MSSMETQVESANAVQTHSQALRTNMMRANGVKAERPVAFYSNIPSCKYVFKAGKVAAFIGGKYVTDLKNEIEELTAEVDAGHPNIKAATDEVIETIEPMEALKAKFFKQFQEQQAAAVRKDNDAGNSIQGKLNVANSTTIGEGAAGSDSPAGMGAPAAEIAPAHSIRVNIPQK